MVKFDMNCLEDDGQPGVMSQVRLIAYPTGASWTGLVRRIVEPLGLKLVSVATTVACHEMIERRPASLLVLEINPREADELLGLLTEIFRQRPRCRVVLFQTGMKPDTELLARELGACDVFSKVEEFTRLRTLAKTHLAEARSRHDNYPILPAHEAGSRTSR